MKSFAYPPFHYNEAHPQYEQITASMNIPDPQPIVETMFPHRRKKREELEAQAKQHFESLVVRGNTKSCYILEECETSLTAMAALQNASKFQDLV